MLAFHISICQPGYLQASSARFTQISQAATKPGNLAHAQEELSCSQLRCFVTFKRDSDRIRHNSCVYGPNCGLYKLPIPGLTRAQDLGTSPRTSL